jgi:hypothetical protein
MTIFGPEWAELTLQDVQSYLKDAEDEPLLWEAKGTRIDKNEVRTQVCGFANSHEGGYLILGADKTPDGWKANGVAFDGEPTTWLSDVIGDPERGVRPRPDFDILAWPADNGHVAVIRVRSTSTPPCIANGTVYERLPGKTPPVRDPVRLASLFGRGDEARRQAQAAADRAAALALDAVTKEEDTQKEDQGEREAGARPPLRAIRFAVGIAATGNPPDIASRLFKDAFATKYWNRLRDLPSVLPEGFARPPDPVEFSQTALLWRREMRGPQDYEIVLRASWDGAVAVAERIAKEDAYLDGLVDHRVGPDWRLADDVMQDLQGFGDFYLTVLFTGGNFPRRPGPAADEIITMRRGPLGAGFDGDHLPSLGRELLRSVGSPVGEP